MTFKELFKYISKILTYYKKIRHILTNIKKWLEKMKMIQNAILEFVDEESNSEENYENLVNIIKDHKINEDPHEFKALLQLINNISNNHQRIYNFINKIDQILKYFQQDIQKSFSNSEIFKVFKDNKRILLFLIQENILLIDEYVVSQITNDENVKNKYSEYFWPEIKDFLTDEFITKHCEKNTNLKNEEFINQIKKEKPEEFFLKRKEGENDDFLCQIIRENKVKEFGVHVSRENSSFDIFINESIYETNPLLINNDGIKLIEYASFFGSIEIVK